jgi:hypothetical protein
MVTQQPARHPTERVGVEFVDTAPHRFTNSVDLTITPEQLFEVLADADAWPRWAKAITKVTWTSPLPPQVGSTRTVDMLGGLVGDEEFLIWKPNTQMAFRFNASSEKNVVAFAENYDVVETATGCHLTWTLAMDVSGPSRAVLPLTKPLLNAGFRLFLRNLRRYTAARFA